MAKKLVFKPYSPNQLNLLPPSLEDLIENNHPVRLVNHVIDSVNIDGLVKQYKGGGTSSYHPRMLLKILIYGYLNNIYSSRKMEASVKENIHFMWLSGMSRPDHNTLNRFRSEKLKEGLESVFSQVVMLLADQGLVSLKEIYTDGTKIEANANKYTFVWGNAIRTNPERMSRQLKELWAYSQQVAVEELNDTSAISFEAADPEKVKQTIQEIDKAISGKEIPQKVKQKLNYVKKNFVENLKKYEQHEKILADRNSYSKTDHDATFMRMKEDHMLNGQLKPGYNLQISTNNQFILNYTLHQQPNDSTTLKNHLTHFNKLYNRLPVNVIADAGYGSEENYLWCDQHNITPYIKYNTFYKDETKAHKKNKFVASNLRYDKQEDILYCPINEPMYNVGTHRDKSRNDFTQIVTHYQAQSCTGCELRDACHQSKGDRVVKINHNLRKYKAQVHALLTSEKGLKLRRQRCVDVEPVFANIKQNKKFKRFNLRGIKKVEIETGLLALAHNLKKMNGKLS